ncbi:MAG TPA: substrate-binding domain-containing protein [Clostridia bacterium]|nr:substrate-binding domain-containing protein [Clostridia bacterium]
MKKILILTFVLLLIFTSLNLTACSKEPSNPDVSGKENVSSEETSKGMYYPYISAVLELPYFIDHRVGLELAGKYWGTKTATLGPSDYDMSAMTSIIDQQIAQKPSALFISAFEDTLAPAINKAVDQDIPVFTIDMDTIKSNRQVFIGGDTVEYGRVHAHTIAEALNGKGDIILMWKMGQNSQDQRAFGFKDELKNYPNIKIVQEVNSETDSSKDADALKAALQANPDVTGISTLVASGPVAAATAVRELGMAGKVMIVGDSKDEATLKLVEIGELYATVAIKTITENWYSAMLMDGIAKNTVSVSKNDKAAGIDSLPSYIDIGTFVIKKDTAKYFYLPKDPFDYSNFKVTAPDKNETYYLVGGVLELPYFIDHRLGFEAACKELGVQGKFLGPSDYDMAAEAQIIEQAISQKPAGILVMAFEDTLAPAIDKAVAAGIPVVTIDMDTIKSNRDMFVGGDTVEYGRIHARTMAEALNGKGDIILMWKMGQNSQDQRALGFKDELKKYPGIRIVQEVNSETDSSKDADALKSALQANPGVTGISTLVASGPVAAATAVRELGMTDKIKIIGDSKDEATLKLLENGELYATVAIKTRIEPYIAMKMLYLKNHTNFSVSQDDKAAGIDVLPSRVDIGTFVIYKDTAKYFYLD